jgi:hypothetical protein
MDANELKAKIDEAELKLIKIQQEKNKAIEKQRYNWAVKLRDQEKDLIEYLEIMQSKLSQATEDVAPPNTDKQPD